MTKGRCLICRKQRCSCHMTKRDVQKLLSQTAPARMTRSSGNRTAFRAGRAKRHGCKLRGVTKLLEGRVWSNGTLPRRATFGTEKKYGHWKGPSGGRRRGSAVDAQVCRLACMGSAKRQRAKKLKLVDMVFRALEAHGLCPVMGQRVVCDAKRGLGTAIDLVCTRGDSLVLVELKTGYSGDRTIAATKGTVRSKMKPPFTTAYDTILNRHLVQLTATTAMFMKEASTLKRLTTLGVHAVESLLVYVTNEHVEIHEVADWWLKRGEKLLSVCGGR